MTNVNPSKSRQSFSNPEEVLNIPQTPSNKIERTLRHQADSDINLSDILDCAIDEEFSKSRKNPE